MFTRPNGDPMAADWLSRYFRQFNDASGRTRRAGGRGISGPMRSLPGQMSAERAGEAMWLGVAARAWADVVFLLINWEEFGRSQRPRTPLNCVQLG